jgi:U4/U6 small nuclear ribonucleoprotein PRP4
MKTESTKYFSTKWEGYSSQSATTKLCQTGHSRGIYTGSLHPDGSLFFTGDLGGIGMVWDLRTGKGVLPFAGHVKGILASDFSPNGYQLATGGDDNMVRIWDLRRRGQIEKIPAHVKLVSHVAFTPGRYLISASYDGTVKTWN